MAMKRTLHILLIINCLAIVKCSTLNACALHHVNITSEPVTIAFSNGEDIIDSCTLDLNIQEGNAISVEIVNSKSSDTYSYLYFEELNNSDGQCLKKYTLISLNSTPCNAFVAYKACRLHLRSAVVTLKLTGVAVTNSQCNEFSNLVSPWLPLSDSSIIPRCQMSAYDSKITHPDQYFTSTIVTCPRKCKCTLGYRHFSILCNVVTNSADILLVYDARKSYLILKSIGLTTILSNALFGIHSVKMFYFTSNRLTKLDAGTFKGLSQMHHLGLDYNRLTFLPATLFHELIRLKSLYLTGNQLSDIHRHFSEQA